MEEMSDRPVRPGRQRTLLEPSESFGTPSARLRPPFRLTLVRLLRLPSLIRLVPAPLKASETRVCGARENSSKAQGGTSPALVEGPDRQGLLLHARETLRRAATPAIGRHSKPAGPGASQTLMTSASRGGRQTAVRSRAMPEMVAATRQLNGSQPPASAAVISISLFAWRLRAVSLLPLARAELP